MSIRDHPLSFIPTAAENHFDSLWAREECYRFYVAQRREHCTFMHILDLWVQAPFCEICYYSDPFAERYRGPEITPHDWREDLRCELGQGDQIVAIVEKAFSEDESEFAFNCKKCQCDLRPWNGDSIWVVNYHLEEHYGIALETPGRRRPSGKLRKRIVDLYDRKCFGCGGSGISKLHIDHIRPQSRDGDSAFRNLQPLCELCGNRKDDAEPEEVSVFNSIYFTSPPSDAYPHMFW